MTCARILIAAAMACALGAPAAAGPSPSASLEGIWTNAWLTTMERRKEFKALVVPEPEATAFEAKPPKIQDEDPVGQEDSEFPERGTVLARIRGTARSGWIYYPADGKIPWTKAAAAANKARGDAAKVSFDDVEQRPYGERCIGAAQAGPPLVNGADANVQQIVQTADHLVIRNEFLNNLRIVRIGAKHGPPQLHPWMGDSIGWWEGNTLVVETTGFEPRQQRGVGDAPAGATLKVTERFTRTSPTELHYAFTVENPAVYAQSWRGEMVLRPAGAIHEYACHEGNYSLPNVLAGGRVQAAASATAQP